MKSFCTLFFLANFLLLPSFAFSQTRKEILLLCDEVARSSIKKNYFNKPNIVVMGLTSWLAAEFSEKKIYRFAASAKIRNTDGFLYAWSFSSTTQYNNQACDLIDQTLRDTTKLVEDDEEDTPDDGSD